MNTEKCPNCGTPLVHTPGRRPKKFCSNNCRSLHWQKTHAKTVTVTLQPQAEAAPINPEEVKKVILPNGQEVIPKSVIIEEAPASIFKQEWVTATDLEELPPSPLIKEQIEEFPPQPAPGSYFEMPVSPPLQQGKGFDYFIEKIPELMYEPEFKAMATEIDNDPGLTTKQKDLLKIKMRTANL